MIGEGVADARLACWIWVMVESLSESSRPQKRSEEAFHAVLHVPILPPVRVSLRRVYQAAG